VIPIGTPPPHRPLKFDRLSFDHLVLHPITASANVGGTKENGENDGVTEKRATRAAEPSAGAPRIVRPPTDEPTVPSAPESERHGWGEDPNDGRRDRDWYENERPPHHGD
jgi:hypothetical protein